MPFLKKRTFRIEWERVQICARFFFMSVTPLRRLLPLLLFCDSKTRKGEEKVVIGTGKAQAEIKTIMAI